MDQMFGFFGLMSKKSMTHVVFIEIPVPDYPGTENAPNSANSPRYHFVFLAKVSSEMSPERG